MVKKHFIVIILVFTLLTLLEIGIFIEALWHGWGGFGDVSLEYTRAGNIGIAFLTFFIPISVIGALVIRIILCIKKMQHLKGVLIECVCALLGIGIVVGIYCMALTIVDNSIAYQWGRQIAAFFIDYFNWMTFSIY